MLSRSETTTLNSDRLHIQESPCSSTAASVVQAFQDDYEVAALDLRGYGKSDKPRVGVLRRVYQVQLTISSPARVDGIPLNVACSRLILDATCLGGLADVCCARYGHARMVPRLPPAEGSLF